MSDQHIMIYRSFYGFVCMKPVEEGVYDKVIEHQYTLRDGEMKTTFYLVGIEWTAEEISHAARLMLLWLKSRAAVHN